MASKQTPTKPAKRGRIAKNADDRNSFCRLCKCSFKVQFGNNQKNSQIATENLFKPSKNKEYIDKGTLAQMCETMGIKVTMSSQLSSRVCRACARKIRTASEHFKFIRARIESELSTPINSPTTSPNPARFKRLLPTTVSTPDRSPRLAKRHSSKVGITKKSLNFDVAEKQDDDDEDIYNEANRSKDNVLSALNVEELIDKSTTQVKTIILYPGGKMETRSTFDEGIKEMIINLSRGNLKAVANIVFNVQSFKEHLLEALRRNTKREFETYCQEKSESILKGNTPVEVASFSNKILVREAELLCPFWMNCLHGACNSSGPGKEGKVKIVNAMALSTAIAAKCRSQKMSLMAYRISTILLHSGVKFEDLKRLNKLGVCMSPAMIVHMEKRMAENCDTKVKFWKKQIEDIKAPMLLLNETMEKQV